MISLIICLEVIACCVLLYCICYLAIKMAMPSFDKAGLFGIDLAKPKPVKGAPPHVFVFSKRFIVIIFKCA